MHTAPRARSRIGLSLLLGLSLRGVSAARTPAEPGAFGKVSFPISCRSDVQQPFNEALALLHSFWYEEARKKFQKVAEDDPSCAMAYWGIAMSLHSALWGSLDDRWISDGREAARKAEQAGGKTAREKRFISAVNAFYAASDLKHNQSRVSAFADAMRPLYAADPRDVEAASFYGLALVGSSQGRGESAPERQMAIKILEDALREAPEHPGATHYLIHACDVPGLARRGLPAARRYAALAPLAPHALHMPSHIFIRLGLWADVIASNLASIQATRQAVSLGMSGDASHQLHAMSFLQYALLQTGREEESLKLIKELESLQGVEPDRLLDAKSSFPARHALEVHDWAAAKRLSVPEGGKPWTRRAALWARAVGAARGGDPDSARADFQRFDELEQEAKIGYPWKRMEIEKKEAASWIALAEGKTEAALRGLREAQTQEGGLESDRLSIPAAEMLGDALLLLKRPAEALRQYEAALALAPGRFDSLFGAGQAATEAGDSKKSSFYFAQLKSNCAGSSSKRPELDAAKAAP